MSRRYQWIGRNFKKKAFRFGIFLNRGGRSPKLSFRLLLRFFCNKRGGRRVRLPDASDRWAPRRQYVLYQFRFVNDSPGRLVLHRVARRKYSLRWYRE